MTNKDSFSKPLAVLGQREMFQRRHIGPSSFEQVKMLESLGIDSLEALIDQAVPASIRMKNALELPSSMTEVDVLKELKSIASENQIARSFIGMGYYNTITPNVILRNLLENPGWYTAYTPYQAEVSQGRLEALLNYQQMVMDLTGMDIANASLLDEATAAAEAMSFCRRISRSKSMSFFASDDCHPQTLDVLKTRAEPMGIELVVGKTEDHLETEFFGSLIQYPSTTGEITDISAWIQHWHQSETLVSVAADLLSLVLLKPPGELGADVVIGNSQRFGVPMGFGGPHAAFFATHDRYKRSMPGRLIGVSVDGRGRRALRMALQTREQHISREKATSNICTAQVLLAVIAGCYATYHGPEGLKDIAGRVHRMAMLLAQSLKKLGVNCSEHFFDTLNIDAGKERDQIYDHALQKRMNLRKTGTEQLGISVDETTTLEDLHQLIQIFADVKMKGNSSAANGLDELDQTLASKGISAIPEDLRRSSDFLTHPVFKRYHSETSMMRYLKHLEDKDVALNRSMIPLGSCTMKLNAAVEMIPVTWQEFGGIHPFVPVEQTLGYQKLIEELQDQLIRITGFEAVSMQPNSGAQGEYTGLLLIHRYQIHRGEGQRNICLIPSSAHGTNPASAMMASMKVVIIECDEDGNIDLEDLEAKAKKHSSELSALMITYPSTHGVFEETLTRICDIIHQHGGQVYMDGANLNALVGIAQPGKIGPDVLHMNLHKTFCIPHGGGGPGMGPIGFKKHLAPFAPSHSVRPIPEIPEENSAVSAAPYGSPGILPISWVYIKLMGAQGLLKATQVAILNANYIASRVREHFPVVYTGNKGRVAHECIIDVRPFRETAGITEEDVAKRLIDYGFHSPTMSWPVAGTLMIEPTESEPFEELDRFCDALIAIRVEIRRLEEGEWDADDNPLHNAPHTAEDLADPEWNHCYTREEAVYPLPGLRINKYWPPVNRIDNVFGDRNVVCSCPPTESYQEVEA